MLRAVAGCCLLTLTIGCSVSGQEPDLVSLGDQTFGDICARCHGQDGHGGLPMTPGGPRPRDFSDVAWQATRTDDQLAATIRAGKSPMPAFAALLSARQIDAVVAKVRRIGKDVTR
jgi:mono/diheme cytochrome c family protein